MGHAIESERQKGSSRIWVEDGLRIEDPDQVIVEFDPYQRLGLHLPRSHPNCGRSPRISARRPFGAQRPERRSRVSFDIEPVEDRVGSSP